MMMEGDNQMVENPQFPLERRFVNSVKIDSDLSLAVGILKGM